MIFKPRNFRLVDNAVPGRMEYHITANRARAVSKWWRRVRADITTGEWLGEDLRWQGVELQQLQNGIWITLERHEG